MCVVTCVLNEDSLVLWCASKEIGRPSKWFPNAFMFHTLPYKFLLYFYESFDFWLDLTFPLTWTWLTLDLHPIWPFYLLLPVIVWPLTLLDSRFAKYLTLYTLICTVCLCLYSMHVYTHMVYWLNYYRPMSRWFYDKPLFPWLEWQLDSILRYPIKINHKDRTSYF